MKTIEYLKFGKTEITLHNAKIIALVILGFERKEIAEKLGIAESTLNTEMGILFKILQVNNAARLAAVAVENGFDTKGRFKRRRIL
jgi:DNA-binding NarL/FixJ family response regulator